MLDCFVNGVSILRVHTREKQFAGQRLVRPEVENGATFVAHPRLLPFEIDGPERQICRFGGETDAIFAFAQRHRSFAALFDNGGEKQERDRHHNQKHLNRKRVFFCGSCRKWPIPVSSAPYCKKRQGADGRTRAA